MPSTTQNAPPQPAAEQTRRPPVRPFKAIQLNCNGQSEVAAMLSSTIARRKIDVALLQEQHTNRQGMPDGFPAGMRCFGIRTNIRRNIGRGSAIVVCSPDIDAIPITRFTSDLGTCVWTKGEYGELIVCSVYCVFRDQLAPYIDYVSQVVEFAGRIPLLIAMDANCRSALWHSKRKLRTDGSGRPVPYSHKADPLNEIIISLDLVVLNEPSMLYTYNGGNGQTDIDVTLGNSALRRFSSQWTILPGETTSDHNAILVELKPRERRTDTGSTQTNITRYRTSNIDWAEFQRHVCEAANSINLEATAEQLCEAYNRAVTAACESCCQNSPGERTIRHRWWNNELQTLKREVRQAAKQYQRTRRNGSTANTTISQADITAARQRYRIVERRYRARIQQAKTNDWRSFVSEDGNSNPWGAVYRICRKKSSRDINSIRRPDGTMTTTWTETAQTLLDAFHPGQRETIEQQPHADTDAADEITIDEISAAAERMNKRRAPGLDGVRADIVRNVIAAAPNLVTALFNKCLSEGRFPAAWKKGNVVSLLKSPLKDVTATKSYRPITLLPVVSKVLERVLINRISLLVQDSPTQYGFTEGRSTTDAWLHVTRIMAESQSKYVLGIFVDFKGAFDNLSWTAILQKLENIGCREIAIWRDYFQNRQSCMIGRQDVVWKEVVRGCPQGSICGPYMWNLVMTDLLRTLTECNIKHVAYADDLLLIVEGTSRAAIETAAQAAVQHAEEWGARVGVEVSSEKTEALLLHGRLDAGRPPRVLVNGQRVQTKQSVRYLGIQVESGLRFMEHLRITEEKVTAIVQPLKRVLRRHWGLKRRAANAWLNGLLKPVAMYGAPVWCHVAMTVKGGSLINSIQRIGLLSAVTACRTVATEALQTIACMPPYDLEARRSTARYQRKKQLPSTTHELATTEELQSSDAAKLIDERMMTLWQQRWTESDKGRTTHQFMPNVGKRDWYFDPTMRTIFLMTGHGSLKAYLHRVNQADTAICGCGTADEDWKHVLAHCPWYAHIRNLDGMGVVVNDGDIRVDAVVETQHSFNLFQQFVDDAFSRRQENIDALQQDE